MKTPFSAANSDFSKQAHQAAMHQVYPHIFSGQSIKRIASRATLLDMGPQERILDGAMGIDYIIEVHHKGLILPIETTVQERFRRPHYAGRKDITITEWNYQTNLPSELYKIKAELFVYGYYDQDRDTCFDWVVVYPAKLKSAILNDAISYSRASNPRTNQSFLAFKYDDLRQADVLASEAAVELKRPRMLTEQLTLFAMGKAA